MAHSSPHKPRQRQIHEIERICRDALLSAFKRHEELGERGTELIQKNQFGDTAMRGDIEAEDAVLTVLKHHNLSAVIHSEEHDDTYIDSSPAYSGVLDGIDGSAWYKSSRGKGRYGTLLGIYEGTDPLYRDYLFSGIMEHATKRLLYGTRDRGSFVFDLTTGQTIPIHTSHSITLTTQTPIHIDQYWDINKKTFLIPLDGYNILEYNLCSSVHYANVALGTADLALECTRKNNLEISAVFGLIHEAGGCMVTHEGVDISDAPYARFGQTTSIPVITAASQPLAKRMVQFLTDKKL